LILSWIEHESGGNSVSRFLSLRSMIRLSPLVTFAMALALLAGCARNPQVAKQKYLQEGRNYLDRGKYLEATIEFENAIQIDPQFAEAHYQLAQCQLKQSDWFHAYQELKRTVEIDPSISKAQLDLADLLLAGRNYAEARDRAETVLKADPRNAQAEIVISNVDTSQGDLAKGLKEAQLAIQMDPNRSGSYLNLAMLQQENKDDSSAEQNFQKALSLDPKSDLALSEAGHFYERQKRWPEAEKLFQSEIASSPQVPLPRAALVALYIAEGQKEKAEQLLKQAKIDFKDNPVGYRMLGDFYLSQGEVDKAAAEFDSLHTEHPKDLPVLKTYIQVLIQQNRLDEASNNLANLTKSFPSDTDAMIFHGEVLTRLGKAEEAVHVLEAAVKIAPENAAAHYDLGVAYAQTSNFGQAESEWRTSARLLPSLLAVQQALATLALRKGDTTLLLDSSTQMIKLLPSSPDGYIFHARALFNRGDAAGAEFDLKKAIDVAPKDSSGYIRLGDLRMGQKRYDEAEKLYAQGLELNPSSWESLTGLVNVDLLKKQPAAAMHRVEDQIARVPDVSRFHLLLGQVALRNQDSGKAERAFQKSTELDKNNVTAFILLADVQVSRGSVDQAIGGYQRALQSNPRDIHLYVSLASLLETRNEWQQAEGYYQKALQIQPDYALAANNLAYLMLDHGGNINVALSLAQTGRKGLPDQSFTADTLGWAYYNQGVYDPAIGLFQEAIKGDAKNAAYHYHLGMTYVKQNKIALAKQQLDETMQISPNYGQIDEFKKAISQAQPNN
jgi:tetratricopeptide (TPR) repeat protein